MEFTRAQVISVTDTMIVAAPLTGPFKDKAYGIESREGISQGLFVTISIHPSGQRAGWPSPQD